MEQCIELRKEIKSAIRQGLLKDFIAQGADSRQESKRKAERVHHPPKTTQQPNAGKHKVINVISTNVRQQFHKQERTEETMLHL